MDHNTDPTQGVAAPRDTPAASIDRFILQPNRSLSARGFVILMSLFGGLCFATGLAFVWIGAWPIMGFLGLDVLLVYLAFRLNYRAARLRETIEISASALKLIRVHPSGHAEAFELNPYWAKIALTPTADGQSLLSMGSHGNVVTFGAFLTEEERRELAAVLRTTMDRHKTAPPQGLP